jgi:hypothetical protein
MVCEHSRNEEQQGAAGDAQQHTAAKQRQQSYRSTS